MLLVTRPADKVFSEGVEQHENHLLAPCLVLLVHVRELDDWSFGLEKAFKGKVKRHN